MTNDPTLLQEAEQIINGQRRDDYGDVTESFNRIADLWTALLGVPIGPYDVANMMILLKVARAANGYHRDSYLDIAGYAGCAENLMLADRQGDEETLSVIDELPPELLDAALERFRRFR